MRFRKLRIATSAAGATICLLLLALWVRSYSRLEILERRIGLQAVQISSVKGHVAFALIEQSVTIGMSYLNVVAGNAADWRKEGALGFAYYDDGLVTALIVPHWLLAFLFAAIAVLPWISQSLQFSLRTLLVAMTLFAVALGVLVWTARRL